jgi:hypothetical protein
MEDPASPTCSLDRDTTAYLGSLAHTAHVSSFLSTSGVNLDVFVLLDVLWFQVVVDAAL